MLGHASRQRSLHDGIAQDDRRHGIGIALQFRHEVAVDVSRGGQTRVQPGDAVRRRIEKGQGDGRICRRIVGGGNIAPCRIDDPRQVRSPEHTVPGVRPIDRDRLHQVARCIQRAVRQSGCGTNRNIAIGRGHHEGQARNRIIGKGRTELRDAGRLRTCDIGGQFVGRQMPDPAQSDAPPLRIIHQRTVGDQGTIGRDPAFHIAVKAEAVPDRFLLDLVGTFRQVGHVNQITGSGAQVGRAPREMPTASQPEDRQAGRHHAHGLMTR